MSDQMSDKLFKMLESVKTQIDEAVKGNSTQTLASLITWGDTLAVASVDARKNENDLSIKFLENRTEQKKIESENKKDGQNE